MTISVLMVGVDKHCVGGMWTVSENFLNSELYNERVNLSYVATSTGGTIANRIKIMLKGYINILFILMKCKIDVVHIHMAERGSVFRKGFVILIARILRKKVIVQMHAGPIVSWYNTLPKYLQCIVKYIFNKPDYMLVLGEYWKIQLSKLIPLEKIKVLYNGTDCPDRNLYNAKGNYILYLGVIKKTKGVYDLVDAIKLIDSKLDDNFKVCLCGKGEEDEIKAYIEKRNLKNRFLLVGWISKEKRIEIFSKTRLVVLPSYFEALSMTVIESMCYGIPVVTTNISTMRELLGKESVLINPGDVKRLSEQIYDFINNKDLCRKISEIEYIRGKELFSIDTIVDNICNLYKDII